jgi:small-conductance mechanosensitive channel
VINKQIYYLPNHVLAKRTVINIQRSSHQWHEFFIQIAANTPSEKIWEVSDTINLLKLLSGLSILIHGCCTH